MIMKMLKITNFRQTGNQFIFRAEITIRHNKGEEEDEFHIVAYANGAIFFNQVMPISSLADTLNAMIEDGYHFQHIGG